MKVTILILFMCLSAVYAKGKDTLSAKIIGLEKAALERWNNGDPSGFLKLSAKDVVYFDPFVERRLDGLENLTKLYEAIRGKVHVDHYDMVNPKVQAVDSMAVLTYNLTSHSGKRVHKWNCTEVYRLERDGSWKIIQTHWSFTKPELK